jgi:hypothetical protein
MLHHHLAQIACTLFSCSFRLAATPLVASLCILLAATKRSIADDWERPSLGFRGISIADNADVLAKFGRLPSKAGIVVLSVSPKSPTAAGGLKPLNVVTTVNRKAIGSMEDAIAVVAEMKPGTPIVLGGYGLTPANVWKSGATKTEVITLRDELMGYVETEHDSIQDVTFYSHVDAVNVRSKSQLQLYVSASSKRKPILRVRLSHVGKEWAFPDNLSIQIGSDVTHFDLSRRERKSEVQVGIGVAEWYDFTADDEWLAMADRIAAQRPNAMRLSGRGEVAERPMSRSEHDQWRTMLDVYRMMTQLAGE